MTVLTQPPTTQPTTTAPAADPVVGAALGRIHEAIASLHDLAALVADCPEAAEAVNTHLMREPLRILVFVGDRHERAGVPERVAALATAAAGHGAQISRHRTEDYGGVNARFGFVELHIYARLDSIGAVTTRVESVQVTDWQPHPLLAALPAGAPGR